MVFLKLDGALEDFQIIHLTNMNTFIFSFLMSWILSVNPPSHDISVALIDIDLEDHFQVSFEMDIEDLNSIIEVNENSLEQYVEDHFKLVINEEEISLAFGSLEIGQFHYLAKFQIDALEERVQSLRILNTIMTSDIADQSNVIRIYYQSKMRGFRMHRGRTEIRADY